MIFFSLLTLATPFILSAPKPKKTPAKIIKKDIPELRGYLKALDDQDAIPEFKIYFNGMETTNNSEGFFSFPLQQKKPGDLSLVICKQIDPQFEKTNMVKEFCLKTGKRHQAFSLKSTSTAGEQIFSWDQRNLEQQARSIPSESIIVLVDPKYVNHLERCNIQFLGNDVILPSIYLKAPAGKSLQHAAVKSQLYSLDSKIFHEKIRPRTQNMKTGQGVINLPW